MPSAISTDSAFGMVWSSSPVRTSVGHLIQASVGRRVRPAHDRGLLADEPVYPTSSPMS